MKSIAWMAAAAALVSTGLPAQGFGSNAEAWEQLSKQYDKDKDGKITKAEYARGDRAFTNLDRNRDGSITEADFPDQGRGRGGQGGGRGAFGGNMTTRIAQMVIRPADADGDGKVTSEEWQKHVTALGADDAGVIPRDKLGEMIPARGRQGGGGRGGMNERMMERYMQAIDANDNDKLEVADLQALFATLDKNEDQAVAGDELGRTRQRGNQRGNRRGGERGGRTERPGAPEKGQVAPDFDLPFAATAAADDAKDEPKTVKLSSYADRKPVALIFGSYT